MMSKTFKVGTFTCEMTITVFGRIRAEWSPEIPARRLAQNEYAQYRTGRNELIAEFAKATDIFDPEATDLEIASRAADYMIAEYGHRGDIFCLGAKVSPAGQKNKKNLEGWKHPPFNIPEVRAWMIDVLLIGHSICVWCESNYEEPTLSLGTLAMMRRRALRRRMARR